MKNTLAWASLALFGAALPATASDFYVTPGGSPTNAGSLSSPWDLQTALNHPAAVRPGDTIWLRGGTYNGTYRSNLAGSSAAPIVVRQYPGERAILDGNNAAARSMGTVLAVYGSYTWLWGFEVTSSELNPSMDPSGPNVPQGVTVYDSHHIKLINLVVHDLPGQGIAWWSENTDSQVHGCIVYFNGLNAWDHGIYVQNRTGIKRLEENLVFQQASHGIHAYGSTEAFLDNLQLEGNTVFNSGYLVGGSGRNILVGGLRVAANPVVKNNYTYFTGFDNNSNLGYSAGMSNAQITGNYFIAGNVALRLNLSSGTFSGNFLTGPTDPANLGSVHPSNTYLAGRPTSGTTVFVRPNAYQPGRAHVTVYNWAKQPTVSVNLAPSGLAAGTPFEVRDAQNYFGAPVLTGTYNGSPVTLPMTGLAIARPVRFASPAHTTAEFGVFVVIPLGAPSLPAAPTNLTASAVSGSRIDLAWTDQASNESGFELQRAPAGTGPWSALATVGANVTTYANTGLSPATAYFYRVRATGGAGSSAFSNVATATTPAAPPPSGGSGLRGEYFDNMDFTAPKLTRTDATVNFDWGSGSPAASISPDTFSARWTGQVQAQFGETYRFYTVSDDGVRLWVNGQLIVTHWTDHAPTEASGTIALAAGQKVDVKLEYYENAGGAVAKLLWSSPSTPKQVVPSSQLFPAAGGSATSRIEAESLTLSGYVVESDTAFGGAGFASGGRYIRVPSPGQTGTATGSFSGPSGTYDVFVAYFDENDGVEHLEVRLAGALVDAWDANQNLGSDSPGLQSRVVRKVAAGRFVGNGAALQIQGTANVGDYARVDYVEFVPVAQTSGLKGEYFDNLDLTALRVTRTDAAVDFDWGSGAPDPSIGADTFSVRWTGQVESPSSETYTFTTFSDDGIRLWVNGQLIVNNWTDHAPTENSGTITLTAGQRYDLKIEFYENGVGAVARLLWSSPSTAKQVVPSGRLFPSP